MFAQNRLIARVLDNAEISLPWPARLVTRSATFQRLAGRAVGLGVRPEHVMTRDVGRPIDRARE